MRHCSARRAFNFAGQARHKSLVLEKTRANLTVAARVSCLGLLLKKGADGCNWPILLKKSVDAAEPMFSASLVRF